MVERGARGDGSARFRVIHVYRGDLAAGDIIVAPASLGFDPPLCMGFTIHAPEPAATRGQYGVVAFHDGAPALHFINPVTLERMFEFGLIERATPVE
ncbi:hypothetical protein BMF35_a1408 [Aurantiacibacter gangjinensis]|uniref:Uncharacterized protein n=1 Tax=Aurantiacibacter gangjinensis TaxID=502682 RepID=A0A0G9MNH2_9SPHN|nr:hypothetical protein BMF35_a1408 [Aurantiacibacter gangjinensis]KLE32134.1 hypothetical protein AAW01_12065 [Aurantiacibacter gangjinensis]